MRRKENAGRISVVKYWLTTEIPAVCKGTVKESLTVHAKQMARADHFRDATKMIA